MIICCFFFNTFSEKISVWHLKIRLTGGAYRIFSSFAARTVTVPVDESGISVKDLARSGADAAYVMPSHQYPTGVVMPIGRRMELLKWAAEEKNRYLIEDDYDSEFRYRGKPGAVSAGL